MPLVVSDLFKFLHDQPWISWIKSISNELYITFDVSASQLKVYSDIVANVAQSVMMLSSKHKQTKWGTKSLYKKKRLIDHLCIISPKK